MYHVPTECNSRVINSRVFNIICVGFFFFFFLTFHGRITQATTRNLFFVCNTIEPPLVSFECTRVMEILYYVKNRIKRNEILLR